MESWRRSWNLGKDRGILELLFIAEESGIHYKVGVSGQTDITKRKKRCTQFSNKFERWNMFCQVFLESLNQLCECLGVWMCVSVSFLLNVFYVFSLFSLVLDVRYRIDKFVKTFFPFFSFNLFEQHKSNNKVLFSPFSWAFTEINKLSARTLSSYYKCVLTKKTSTS